MEFKAESGKVFEVRLPRTMLILCHKLSHVFNFQRISIDSDVVLQTFLEDLEGLAEAETKPSMQGRTMSMIIAPKKET
eukprot:scaffold81408_cov21-Prasinocladus_malaysianus.AAC.1